MLPWIPCDLNVVLSQGWVKFSHSLFYLPEVPVLRTCLFFQTSIHEVNNLHQIFLSLQLSTICASLAICRCISSVDVIVCLALQKVCRELPHGNGHYGTKNYPMICPKISDEVPRISYQSTSFKTIYRSLITSTCFDSMKSIILPSVTRESFCCWELYTSRERGIKMLEDVQKLMDTIWFLRAEELSSSFTSLYFFSFQEWKRFSTA